MADKAEATAAEEKPKAGKAGGGSKLLLLLMAVNSLLLAGVLGVLLLRPPGAHAAPAAAPASAEHAEGEAKPEHGEEKKPEEHSEGGEKAEGAAPGAAAVTVRLADFIVHLRDAENDRYARLSFEIEVKEERAKDVLTARMPQIRDAFLAYLSDRTVEELRGSEAMAQLKEALARRLHDIAPHAPVKALYVTDLVLQ